jgi:hypothetical protein
MPTNRDKFKALVHYVCSLRSARPDTLGAVKLNKILWLAEISAFYRLGNPITQARYIKRKFGPVPAPIMRTLRELDQDGVLSVRDASHYGLQKKEYIVYIPATEDFLSLEEAAIVKEMVDYVCDEHTAASVSEATHDHVWKAAEDGEEIPHYTVFANAGKITDEDRGWAKDQLACGAA